MNKRFSTLLAIALMAGGLSASAQYQPTNQAKVTKLEAGRYYHIANGTIGDDANFLSATKRAGADSIIVKTTFADVASVDSALWLITKSTQSVTGKDVYSFVNKATNAKLQFKKEGNAMVAAGLNEWTWSLTADSLLSNVTAGVTYTIETTGVAGEVKVLKGSTSLATAKGWSAYNPIDIALTADQLNDANNTYFKLAFGNDITDNIFTKYKMKATQAGSTTGGSSTAANATTTDSVFVQLTDHAGFASQWGDKKATNKNVYLVVDSTFHEIGSATWTNNGGFVLNADTLRTNSDGTTLNPDTVAAGERNLSTYKFLFLLNKGAVSGDSLIVKVNTPAVVHKTASVVPANEKATNAAYLSWGFIGNTGTKVLTTAGENTKLPLISFLQGTKVTDLDETKAYFIKVVKGQNKDNNGKDYVIPYLTGSASYVKDATSALVPATQWSVVKNAAGNYTFTNREDKSATFTTPIYKDGDNYVLASQQDTVSLTGISTDGKYVGYKNFTNEELGNLSVSLQFVTPLGTSAYVYVAKDDSMLRAKNMEETDATKFKLVAVNTAKFGADSLERSAYILKEQFGAQRVLGYDAAGTKLFRLMKTNQTTADSTAVIFRATKNAGEYQVFTVSKSGGTTAPYTFDALTAVNQSTIAGSTADMYAVGVADQVTGFFKITTPEAPEYINLTKNSSAHVQFSSSANSSLMIGMSEKFEPVLKAASEMDAAYSLFVDTANVTDQANPKFYLMTTAGLGDLKAETTDEVLANYLTVNADNKLEFIVGKQFGATKDTLLVYNREDMTADPDTVKMADNKSMFKFRATPSTGEMLIEAVGGANADKYMQQINGKLILTDLANALPFTTKVVDTPTGNESTEANTISVVAGEGNVTVYGAAGKEVIVSNVLGQKTTIVATSDSEVIAAPQGVVIVAVEGETAVKAVVK